MGLPWCTSGLAVQSILGLKTFKELIYSAQLKFLVRLQGQDKERWSHDALMAHVYGDWRSPYLENLTKIKMEIGMLRNPVSNKHVDIVVEDFFLRQLNHGIKELNLPAMLEVDVRRRGCHVNESAESKVGVRGVI